MTSRFVGAVRFGDTVHGVLKVAEKKESKKSDRGIVNVNVEVHN